MDVFPELINTENDTVRDIEASEKEGIVETTHFILSYLKSPITLSFEYNHYGPRISDFLYLITHFGISESILTNCEYNPLTRDDLTNYKERIHRCSFFIAKVHKDNVRRINQIDSGLFTALDTASSISDPEYVSISLKYDYKKMGNTNNIKKIVNKIIEKFKKDKGSLNMFDTLRVKAEDGDNRNKLREFDLLNIWVTSEVKVEKREKSRAIVSIDMFEKMKKELYKEFTR
jgi:hypothetical protein